MPYQTVDAIAARQRARDLELLETMMRQAQAEWDAARAHARALIERLESEYVMGEPPGTTPA